MSTPFIRLYNPSLDFENGLHVFYVTMDKTLDHEPLRTIGSHLWYRTYVSLSPKTCVILDDGNGRAVGYCIGASNTSAFSDRWRKEYAPTVDTALISPPDMCSSDPAMETNMVKGFRKVLYQGECSMLLSLPSTLQKYPAHLHIDLLPEFQRQGWGRKLTNAFFEAIRAEGAKGVHLDMVKWNEGAKLFYEKLGFEKCAEVLDGGESGETGVNGVVLTLVKKL